MTDKLNDDQKINFGQNSYENLDSMDIAKAWVFMPENVNYI